MCGVEAWISPPASPGQGAGDARRTWACEAEYVMRLGCPNRVYIKGEEGGKGEKGKRRKKEGKKAENFKKVVVVLRLN